MILQSTDLGCNIHWAVVQKNIPGNNLLCNLIHTFDIASNTLWNIFHNSAIFHNLIPLQRQSYI